MQISKQLLLLHLTNLSQKRGLVPSLKISSPALGGEHILIESAIIVQFLADVVPGRLAPPSNNPLGAIYRARLNFFIDTWNTKVGTLMFHLFKAASPQERELFANEWVKAVAKEIEPLLADADPYFAGSKKMTLAEVMVAPFIMRIHALAEANVLPKCVVDGLDKLPNFGKWSANVKAEKSVTGVWDAENFVQRTNDRLEKMAQMKQAQLQAQNGHARTAAAAPS
jgi:glutathione S-transferase